jgi:predicted aldo/keto reductase-like oxidoreductase
MMHNKTIRLGKSGLEVTRIGFGGIPIQRLGEPQAVRVIRRALDGGLNWIDTANAYGNSEERIGKAIRSYPRAAVLVFTKGGGRDPKSLREQIELSFERLQTDYIDLFQFHNVLNAELWKTMQDNGSFDLLRRYRERGRIHHIGASAHSKDAARAVIGHPEIEVLQFPFNFIVEDEGKEVVDACRDKDIGFIAMKPFGGGALEDASACIRYLLAVPDIVADPGFQRIEEVEEVLSLWKEGAALTEENRRTIEQLRRVLGTRFCRRCGYCMPCPQEVDIVTLMTMETLVKRFPADRLSEGWISGAAGSAENCIECGECEDKCPYDLPIVEEIQRGAEAFQRELRAAG